MKTINSLTILTLLATFLFSCNSKKEKTDWTHSKGARMVYEPDTIVGKWKTSNEFFTFFRNGVLINLSMKDGNERIGTWKYNSFESNTSTLTLYYSSFPMLLELEHVSSDSIVASQLFVNSHAKKFVFTKVQTIGLDSVMNDLVRCDGVYFSNNDTNITYLRFYGDGSIVGSRIKSQFGKQTTTPELFREQYHYKFADRKSFWLSRDIKGWGDTLSYEGKVIGEDKMVISAIDLNRKTQRDENFVFVKSDILK
jgi:hypothetical protein